MKIRKYLNGRELTKFEGLFQYAYDCDYCLINHDEEGDKNNIEIYTDHLEQVIEVQEQFEEDCSKQTVALAKELLEIMEKNEIDFVGYI